MIKRISLLMLAISGLLVLGACSDSDEASNNSNKDSTYKMKIGHVNPEGEPTNEVFEHFVKPELEERSDGRLEVEIYPQSQLGSENELTELTKIGTVDVSAASVPSNHAGKLDIFYLPYLFTEQEELWDVMDGSLSDEINEYFEEEAGVKVMGWWSVGTRHMFTTDKMEVKNLDDLKGAKIRVMEKDVITKVFEKMGMLPTPLPYDDVYSSISTKVVDGAENDPSGYKNMKFYEVGPNLSLTAHLNYPKTVMMNDDFYNDLPEDLQEVVDDVFKEAETEQREMFMEVMDEDLEWLEENGTNIIEDVDVSSFQKRAEELYDELDGIDHDFLNKVIEERDK